MVNYVRNLDAERKMVQYESSRIDSTADWKTTRIKRQWWYSILTWLPSSFRVATACDEPLRIEITLCANELSYWNMNEQMKCYTNNVRLGFNFVRALSPSQSLTFFRREWGQICLIHLWPCGNDTKCDNTWTIQI